MWNYDKTVTDGRYVWAHVPNHPRSNENDYIAEHTIVAENNLGRLLRDNEIVHHKNENRKDNRWGNLEVMDRGRHTQEHGKENEVTKLVILFCHGCNRIFARRRGQTHLVKKSKKNITSCSRSCAATIKKYDDLEENVIGQIRTRAWYADMVREKVNAGVAQ